MVKWYFGLNGRIARGASSFQLKLERLSIEVYASEAFSSIDFDGNLDCVSCK